MEWFDSTVYGFTATIIDTIFQPDSNGAVAIVLLPAKTKLVLGGVSAGAYLPSAGTIGRRQVCADAIPDVP
ncbi:MAG TPA: hypothetical protein K8V32_08050 [Enteractinococcus helveticum]|uniref:Uncharacterized protein n=1 Tax=Enteractinococcus helveticum TaxID=1837282 RepID=A0A921FN48_9MICC|nr:hypothetical protein [Enteractinococcus helveticum]HJF14744.1 hypothetical protein [Enteractinococcus helveticum]